MHKFYIILRVLLPAIVFLSFYRLAIAQQDSNLSQSTAQLSSVQPSGESNTSIDASANGITIINIANPDNSGLSHNKYSNFNVDNSGVILNNSSEIANTALAGFITANPNLGNPASIILNEVTSRNPSIINGYIEVAGNKAEVIIANPNGINLASAGFVNASKITAITGSSLPDLNFNLRPKFDNANFLPNNFLPSLVIEKEGINLENDANLVANKINVSGSIYGDANAVFMQTGDDIYDYKQNKASSIAKSNDSDLVAIDVANFAQIQAKNIYLITTQNQANIKQNGDLLASNAIEIDSAGNLFINNAVAEEQNINITAKNVIQNGIMYSKNGNVNLQNQYFDNFGSIVANGDIAIVSQNINNNKQIIAENIAISGNNLNNYATISASKDLQLSVVNLLNNANISSNNNLSIDVALLSNNGDIGAKNQFNIKANNIENKQNIFSMLDLSISSSNINNINSISAQNNLQINTNNFNNDNGLILAKNLLEINSANINNNRGKLHSLGNININNPHFWQITGELTAINNISLFLDKANNVGNIASNGNINIVAVDFANNNKISAQNLKINAGNYLLNNGEITMVDGFSASSATFNNNGKISANNGLLLATTINNNSQLSFANVLEMTAGNINNKGSVEALSSANIKANDAVINDGLIYAHGDINLLISNNLTNNAIIYADNNLKITNNGTRLAIDNNIANIEAGKNIIIDASIINNRGMDYDPDSSGFYGYNVNYGVFQNSRGNGFMSLMYKDIAVPTLRTKQAKITSGFDLLINNAVVNNYGSSISAKNNIIINKGALNNQTSSLIAGNLQSIYGMFWNSKSCTKGRWNCKHYYHEANETKIDSAIILSQDVANIRAGNDIIINQAKYVNNGYLNNSLGLRPAMVKSNLATINIDNQQHFLINNLQDTANSFLFVKNISNNKPLFETRLQFIDQSQFLASDYFYHKMGIVRPSQADKTNNDSERFIGDQFVQNKLIIDQLNQALPNIAISDTSVNASNTIASLIDNAKTEQQRLNLAVDKPLDNKQISDLQKNILWFESILIDNNKYIIPRLYLAKNYSPNNQDNSYLLANGDIKITADNDINNFANIEAKNIELSANNIINNPFAKLFASNNFIASANNSLFNFGKISVAGNAVMRAKSNIVNASIIGTNQELKINNFYVNDLASEINTASRITDEATIKANNLDIIANDNFLNLAANIVADQDIKITAGNIKIDSLIATNSQSSQIGSTQNGSSWHNTTQSNLNSNISAGNDLMLTTQNSSTGEGDINISGANLEAKSNLAIISAGDIKISSVIDKSTTTNASSKKNSMRELRTFSELNTATNKKSTLSANNISLASYGDTDIVASDLSAKNDIKMSVGYDENGQNRDANLHILNGIDTTSLYSQTTKIKTGFSIGNALFTATMIGAVALSGGVGLAGSALFAGGAGLAGSVNKQKNTTTSFHYNEKSIASDISFGGNLMLLSPNLIQIKGSNLNRTTSNASASIFAKDLLIESAIENSSSSIVSSDKGNYFAKSGFYATKQQQILDNKISDVDFVISGNFFAKQSEVARPFLLAKNSILAKNNLNINKTSRQLTQEGTAMLSISTTAVAYAAMPVIAIPASPTTVAAINGASIGAVSAASSASAVMLVNGGDISITNQDFIKTIFIGAVSGGLSGAATPSLLSSVAPKSASYHLAKGAINAASSSATVSVVDNQDILQLISEKGKYELIMSSAKIGAMQIGEAYHPNPNSALQPINKQSQLSLHFALGCSTALSLNSSCFGGGYASIVGESIAESAYNAGINKNTAVDIASLFGSINNKDANLMNQISKNSAENNAITVWMHEIPPESLGFAHVSIKIQPENQEKYANNRYFNNINNNGKRYATIGAGPDDASIGRMFFGFDLFGNLIAGQDFDKNGLNRKRDIDRSIKVYESENLVSADQEDYYIAKLFQANKNYQNQLEYELFPQQNESGYNSNSYVSGILLATNLPVPELPSYTQKTTDGTVAIPIYKTPGYNKPVPAHNFDKKYKNNPLLPFVEDQINYSIFNL